MKRHYRMTDRKAIQLALNIAIDTEDSLIDAWDGDDREESVITAKKNIAAFRRVLNRYFGGPRKDPLAGTKMISMVELLKLPPQEFKVPDTKKETS